MILSNDGLVAFHYRSYGTFFYNKIGSMISIGDLPTTNIIEPQKSVGLKLTFYCLGSWCVRFKPQGTRFSVLLRIRLILSLWRIIIKPARARIIATNNKS